MAVTPAKMPKYKLINEADGQGTLTSHIESVTHGRGKMVNSPLDKDSTSALGAADNDYSSYYQMEDWDDGVAYPGEGKGLTFTFDKPYKMNYIAFAEGGGAGQATAMLSVVLDTMRKNPKGKQASDKVF